MTAATDLLYFAAIRCAIDDLTARFPTLGRSAAEPLVCVVVGGGMGRLPFYCLDIGDLRVCMVGVESER